MPVNKKIFNLRHDFKKGVLKTELMAPNPIDQFQYWLNEAIDLLGDDALAMTLSTVSLEGQPSSRIVLLRENNQDGFTFFTNYHSNKGIEIKANNKASLLFFWKELERQVGITGTVSKTSDKVSDAYFQSRPLESRISAIVSKQSQVISHRQKLDDDFDSFRSDNSKKLDRPRTWGGYILNPQNIEFWQGRENRLHDRIVYQKTNNGWEKSRLSP